MAAAPYSPGDLVVFLESTPHGLSVHRAIVVSCDAQGENCLVVTTHGAEIVGPDGSGARLLPMDDELAEEFKRLGDGYVVLPTMPGRARDTETRRDPDGQERGL